MKNWFKLSHRSHSGRLRPHEFTSYPALFAMLIFVGFTLSICTVAAKTPYDGPESGAVALSGTMPGPPPNTPAVITSPTNGQQFTTSPVTIKGTCPKDTLVEIFKNGIFAGSGPCSANGSFSFDIDLLIGKNSLSARDYDALNQEGPKSASVIVNYNPSLAQSAALNPVSLSGAQLLLNTDAVFRGVFPNQTMSIPISILGGTPPYAINIQWGDSTSKIVPRNNNLTFSVDHVYSKPGTYQITIQATDSQGRVAFLTVAAIVNGQPSVLGTSGPTQKSATNKLLVLWPLYTTSAAVVISFWLGERREKHMLAGPTYTFHPQG